MSSSSRIELFESEKLSKAIPALCIPTVASSLVTIVYSLADTFFVGMLNNPVQTAAVSLASPVLLAFNAVNNLFGVGSSSMMSRALGVSDFKTLHQSSSFGFYGAIFFGALFSLACAVFLNPLTILLGADASTASATQTYLFWTVILGAVPSILNVVMAYFVRSEGATLHASIGTMSGCFLNMILDPIFILGFHMEAQGAALATFISNCVAVAYFFGYLFFKRNSTFVSISPKDFTLKKNIVFGVCSVGIPASIQNLLNVVSQMLLNNLAAGYGTATVAGMGIAARVNTVPIYLNMGISQGVMPLFGYCYSAKLKDRFKEAVSLTFKILMVVMISMTAIYQIFPEALVSAFISDSETVAAGSFLIRGMALAVPFLVTDFLAVFVFQSVGLGSRSLIMALTRKLVLEIPAMFILNALFGWRGLGFAQFCAEFVMAIFGMFLLRRFINSWMSEEYVPKTA
jgi:putative MATE family efflux protein